MMTIKIENNGYRVGNPLNVYSNKHRKCRFCGESESLIPINDVIKNETLYVCPDCLFLQDKKKLWIKWQYSNIPEEEFRIEGISNKIYKCAILSQDDLKQYHQWLYGDDDIEDIEDDNFEN